MPDRQFPIGDDLSGQTLAAVLRMHLTGQSWTAVRQLVAARRVKVGAELCLDPARRLQSGDVVVLLAKPEAKARTLESITIRHVDDHIVVVEKPAGMSSVRHPAELEWSEGRKALSPTLVDLVYKKLAARECARSTFSPRLRVVQRLDKDTSGLLVFARTHLAERELGKRFRAHTIHRQYLAIIPGTLPAQTITSYLVRDRGDGLRGSTPFPNQGKRAVTHIHPVESSREYSLLACRLETGKTHQIRIHLAELGHPICGEKVYCRKRGGACPPDRSGAPRLALHAAELGFPHPATGEDLFWEMPLPRDVQEFWQRCRTMPGK